MSRKQDLLDIEEEKKFLIEQATAKKLAAQAAKAERESLKLAEMTRTAENVSKGMAQTFAKHREETDAVSRGREFGVEIRNWHRDVRVKLSGRRLAINNPSKAVFLVDLLYSKWAKRDRPAKGVEYSIDSLLKSAKVSRSTLFRELRSLVAKGILRRQQPGKRDGEGGRSLVCYTFPTFPDRKAFDETWERAYESE
jgi:hypothetical protein